MPDDSALPRPTTHVFIAASLDGYIARSDGDIAWLDTYAGQEEHGYTDFIARMDGLVMGRGTFEKVLTFGGWPFDKPVVVLSRSMTTSSLPAELAGKARISGLPPRELLAMLAREGWRRAYIDGGKVIQSFLNEGLLDDLVVTRIPVLLGGGIPLFGPSGRDVSVRHVETRTFASGLVQSKYEVVHR